MELFIKLNIEFDFKINKGLFYKKLNISIAIATFEKK